VAKNKPQGFPCGQSISKYQYYLTKLICLFVAAAATGAAFPEPIIGFGPAFLALAVIGAKATAAVSATAGAVIIAPVTIRAIKSA